MEYRWPTPVGMCRIRRRSDGRWTLLFGEDAIGSFHSAQAAADDVHAHATGYHAWDRLSGSARLAWSAPEDVREWQRAP